MPDDIKKLASFDILVHGFVEDLEPILDSVRVNVAPLRYGAGTKGKVVMAMANGLPSVGTSIAFEGMGITNYHHALCADTALMFSRAVVALYNKKILWERVSKAGLELSKQAYSFSTIERILQSSIIPKGILIK
jgi:glycosyltransferase involved in cell wall biosynthesis